MSAPEGPDDVPDDTFEDASSEVPADEPAERTEPEPTPRRGVTRFLGLGLAAAIAAVVVVVVVVTREEDPFERYCAEVRTQQTPLTEAAAQGAPQALLLALPSFERLSEVAPDDLVDEWAIVVQRISRLEAAIDAAGIDVATYDPAKPPEDLTDADQARLTSAASGLLSPAMKNALDAVQQQARDVCKTPLSL